MGVGPMGMGPMGVGGMGVGGMGMPGGAPSMGMGGMGMGGGGGVVTSSGPLNVAPGSTPTATTLECAKSYVGRLIGRGGETINMIQSRSGARVQIEQNVPEGQPCRVNVTGVPQSVMVGVQLVQDIISNGPNSAATVLAAANPMQMGMGMGGGGYYGGGMAGGYGGMQQQQPSMYGGYPSQGMYGQQQQGGGGYPAMSGAGYGQQPAGAGTGYGQSAPWSGGHSSAQASAPPPLPAGWTEHKTEDGNTYWYNSATATSQVRGGEVLDSRLRAISVVMIACGVVWQWERPR